MKRVVPGSDLNPWYGSKSHYQPTKWSHLILSKLNKLHCGFAIIPLWELCASLFTQLLCGWKQETFTSGKNVCNFSQVNTVAPAYTSTAACLWCQQRYRLEIKQFLFCQEKSTSKYVKSLANPAHKGQRKALEWIPSNKKVLGPEVLTSSKPPCLPLLQGTFHNSSGTCRALLAARATPQSLLQSPEKLSTKDNCPARRRRLSAYLQASFQVLWAINGIAGKSRLTRKGRGKGRESDDKQTRHISTASPHYRVNCSYSLFPQNSLHLYHP